MKLFTLIHVEEKEQSLHNNTFVKNFEAQIKLYLSCAIQLHVSLRSEGVNFSVITNNQAYLERLNYDKYPIEIIQLDFNLRVPTGIKFFSAHFKIELFKYLSSLNYKYVGLIDSDVICVNSMPSCLKFFIEHQIPLYYDITNQRAYAYGIDKLISDKEKISNYKSCGLWAGGEFITGSPEFFGRLYAEVSSIEENYFKNFQTLHHQGDEMITSTAIENLKVNQKETIIDAGNLLIIGRYWSPHTLHVQSSVEAFTKHFLLHLPADKKFLASLNKQNLKGTAFFRKYRRYLILNSYKNILKFVKPFMQKIK